MLFVADKAAARCAVLQECAPACPWEFRNKPPRRAPSAGCRRLHHGSSTRVEEIYAGGKKLDTNVEKLVSAMASFGDPPAAGLSRNEWQGLILAACPSALYKCGCVGQCDIARAPTRRKVRAQSLLSVEVPAFSFRHSGIEAGALVYRKGKQTNKRKKKGNAYEKTIQGNFEMDIDRMNSAFLFNL
jgi:hypothetical protein